MSMQILLAAVSWLLIPLVWLAGYSEQNRVRGRLGIAIIHIGILVLVIPWITMPILGQPRVSGSVRMVLGIAGAVLAAVGVILSAWGVHTLVPSTGWVDDISPEHLVTEGPYGWMRHPLYVAGVSLVVGYILLTGAVYSLLLCPVFYLLLRYEAYLEEKRVLEPKFGDEFRRYKARVPRVFLGRVGTAALALSYLLLAAAFLAGMVPIAD